MSMAPEGGGGSSYAAIDVGELRTLIRSLEDAAETLRDAPRSLRPRASYFGIGTDELRELEEIGAWADDELPGLRRRLNLAQELDHMTGGLLSTVDLSEPTLTTAAAEELGADLANRMTELTNLDEEAAEVYHEIALELRAYAHDPDVMSAFFAALGPDQVQMLPSQLVGMGSPTAAEDLESFSYAFSVAARDLDPADGFTDVLDAFTTEPLDPTVAWDRLAMVQYGDFDSTWLTDVVRVNALDEFMANPDQDFRGSMTGARATGLPEDIVALAFNALRDNPVAARSALNSMGPMDDVVDLVYGFADTRSTGDEIADAFGLAVEAGAGVHDEQPGEHSDAAARFAFTFITATARHDDAPWPIKDSLAAVGASYSHEITTGARTDNPHGESVLAGSEGFKPVPGLDPSFHLSPDDTYAFLRQFAHHDEFTDVFDEAMDDLQGEVFLAAAEDGADGFRLASHTLGAIAGMQYKARLDVRGDMDDFDRKAAEVMQTVLTFGFNKAAGQVTPQGRLATWGWKALTWGVNKTIPHVTGPPEETDTRVGQQEASFNQMVAAQQHVMAKHLYDAGYPADPPPPPGLLDGGTLKPLEVLAEEQRLGEFDAWLSSTDDFGTVVRDMTSIFNGKVLEIEPGPELKVTTS